MGSSTVYEALLFLVRSLENLFIVIREKAEYMHQIWCGSFLMVASVSSVK